MKIAIEPVASLARVWRVSQLANPSNSISMLGSIFIERFRHLELDAQLIHTSLIAIDCPVTTYPAVYAEKAMPETDLLRYQAFTARYQSLDPTIFRKLHQAFLLQFAQKDHSDFPDEAQIVISYLRSCHQAEVFAHQAIILLDRFMYGFNQYIEESRREILNSVLDDITPQLDRLAEIKHYRFGELFWTPGLRHWCRRYQEMYRQGMT